MPELMVSENTSPQVVSREALDPPLRVGMTTPKRGVLHPVRIRWRRISALVNLRGRGQVEVVSTKPEMMRNRSRHEFPAFLTEPAVPSALAAFTSS
jgi:hypothetical protein